MVEDVIDKLNLRKCAATVVGSPGLVRGISGGERKRTNVALSLIGSPSLLLLDEPTSGLDSKMSDSLIQERGDMLVEKEAPRETPAKGNKQKKLVGAILVSTC